MNIMISLLAIALISHYFTKNLCHHFVDASAFLTVSSAFRNPENVVLLLEIGSQENEDDNFRNMKLVPPQQVVFRLIAPCEKWQEARLGRLWPTELYTGYFDTVNVTLRRSPSTPAFQRFRLKYLLVFIAVMLADGLQGTHLYALYHGYGLNVPNLYALGFVVGAVTSPFIGPLVDKYGRRKSAVIYCFLEMIINALEQYNFLPGIIASRLIGGVTTNLLFTVFESWLITEHRSRGFPESQLALLLRDSVVSSNLSAIGSGFLAHFLADSFGPAGPFKGTVLCSGIALILVATQWEENYGSCVTNTQSLWNILCEAIKTILSDSKILRLGVIQALTEGALQTFVFLWAPFLLHQSKFSTIANSNTWGLDGEGLPAFGLIFGSFMLFGAAGGLTEPLARNLFATFMTPSSDPSESSAQGVNKTSTSLQSLLVNQEQKDDPTMSFTVEMLSSLCFLVCSALLLVPHTVSFTEPSQFTFTLSVIGFIAYEYVVGIYLPCEGIMRSVYMPSHSICSVMTVLRVVVNLSVALGVASTNYISITAAFNLCSLALVLATFLQLTLVRKNQWEGISKHTFKNKYPALVSSER